MKRFLHSFLFLSFFSLILVSFNCHKDVTKEEKPQKMVKPDTVPPGHAFLSGEISTIEPIQKNANGPCSEYPCIAMVKVKTMEYGAGFPVVTIGKQIEVKFAFTLNKTTKDMFPNMDDSYPGLKVGDNFEALVAFSETARIGSGKSTSPSYTIYGYKIINK